MFVPWVMHDSFVGPLDATSVKMPIFISCLKTFCQLGLVDKIRVKEHVTAECRRWGTKKETRRPRRTQQWLRGWIGGQQLPPLVVLLMVRCDTCLHFLYLHKTLHRSFYLMCRWNAHLHICKNQVWIKLWILHTDTVSLKTQGSQKPVTWRKYFWIRSIPFDY